ncbi:hypothetical protein C8R30_1279 [Nitrosomonas nitrosa]|uniref:hypothetical protein n=1 Tax=Nitrosomonas nitrosa TaxID=52442 RepID=UPI000D45221B|nr:hypothetical protein [Nitrosomonas nitrosa]PTQ91905.1 hypothetical protein C8R30_1279 [Nitrosomonas nitrosa]
MVTLTKLSSVYGGIAVTCIALSGGVQADSVRITFEQSENESAVSGVEATGLYASMGVRFPSRPTIEWYGLSGQVQVLQQGKVTFNRVNCEPLVMEFEPAMAVREVGMRVINRHVRDYTIEAFSDLIEVDSFRYVPAGGSPHQSGPLSLSRNITLRAEPGEGNITRVVATPPSDCFDLMVIDNLSYETLHPVTPISAISVLAYEVTQGIMSRLTHLGDERVSYPDTRVMALPEKRLTYVSGRDTGVRFFLGASGLPEANFNGDLSVTVFYEDGSRKTKMIRENTEGGSNVPLVERSAEPSTLRRVLAQRRAQVDQSLDYVIPGKFLQNARSMRLTLTTIPTGMPLANININFVGPYSMGLDIIRVNGMGRDAGIGLAPTQETADLITRFIQDLYPITGSISVRNNIVTGISTGGSEGGCRSLLSALDSMAIGTNVRSPISDVNFWTYMYIVQSPPCGGVGSYNLPGLLTSPAVSTAAHEVSHNIGINHASNQHNESLGGTLNDWERWPYTHGSIGAIDEMVGFNDGVFGVVMRPNMASVDLDMIDNWGVWTLSPIAPCQSVNPAQIFPACTSPDANLVHDYMSYGPKTLIPIWGAQHWISDVNYHRLLRWFENCRVLDPPHQFMTGGTSNVSDTSGMCSGAGTLAGRASSSIKIEKAPREGFVFSGLIEKDGVISKFNAVRKRALAQSFINPAGPYRIVFYTEDGIVIRSIPFNAHNLSGGGGSRIFSVVAPFDAKLARVEIYHNKKIVFSKDSGAVTPTIELLSPRGGEVWRSGKQRIKWKHNTEASEIYIQYSPDKGTSWYPLGLVGSDQNYLDVNVEDLFPSNNALLYLSTTKDLKSGMVIIDREFAIGQNSIIPQDGGNSSLDFKEDCIQHDPNAIEIREVNSSWKIVQGNRWLFDFESKADEAKAAYAAIKRYGFDTTCYVGRPNPSMIYLKKGKSIPGGSSQGADCINIDWNSVRAQQEGSDWVLLSNRSRIAMFPNETEAKRALSVVKAYRLNRQCFIGRPGPSFKYWLSAH